MGQREENLGRVKILVLCHGNVNRSPLCAAVLGGFSHLEVRQAGLKTKNNTKAARKTRVVAAELGHDLEAHRSRELSESDLIWNPDYIIVMSVGNFKRLAKRITEEFHRPSLLEKALYLGAFLQEPKLNIADPGFMKADDPKVRQVAEQVIEASTNFANFLKESN